MNELAGDVKCVLGLTPQNVSGSGATYGPAIDRKGYGACVLNFLTGALAGTPTNVLYTFGLEESATETGTYAAVTLSGNTLSGVAANIPGVNTEVNVDLKARKRWVKPIVTPTWTGGSSPYGIVGCVVVLGEADVRPAA
jgi:hypothetical protein